MKNNDLAFGSGDSIAQNPENTTKLEAILRIFAGGKSLNRFEAERHHDHCLHSTISSFERLGIEFDRAWECCHCLRGRATVRVKRYWLRKTPENLARARGILAGWRARHEKTS
jgi:hypothetical protein